MQAACPVYVKFRARIKTKTRRQSLISFVASSELITMGNLREGTFEIVKKDDGKGSFTHSYMYVHKYW